MFKSLKLKKSSTKASEKPLPEASEKKKSGSSFFPSPNISSANAVNSLGSIINNSNTSLGKKFKLFQISHYGLEGIITHMAYDQTQSLLAVSTSLNELVLYGKNQVEAHINLDFNKLYKTSDNDLHVSIVKLQFVKGIYLIVCDSKSSIHIVSILSNKVLTSFYAPGKITALESDPTLSWILVGLEDGTVKAYDVDKDFLSEFTIKNIQRSDIFTNLQISPVNSITWNPRNIGQVLISYDHVTVLYNFLEKSYKMQYIYELPPGAPGGGYKSASINEVRFPKTIKSIFHPNGLHMLTLHNDNSLVFWDLNTGKLILARNLYDTKINKPGTRLSIDQNTIPVSAIKDVKWISGESSEYTQLLVVGGDLGSLEPHTLTIIDLGGTPLYSVSSYEKMKSYYGIKNNQKILSMNTEHKMVEILSIPRTSPFYNGEHNPGILLILYDNGLLDTMLYPSGKLTFKSSLLPQSLSWIRPFANLSTGASVPSKVWIGMMHSTYNKDSLLKGGITKNVKTRKLDGYRSVIITSHENGSIRLFDGSHSELMETSVFDINLSNVLNTKVVSSHVSYAPFVSELAVACKDTGDVCFFKFDKNRYYQQELTADFARFRISPMDNDLIIDISHRSSPNLRDGFMPQSVVHAKAGQVSCLKSSNIGFVCIGYSNGSLMVVDKRGPAVIFFYNIKDIIQSSKNTFTPGEVVTSAQFGILQVGNDSFSSIVLSCGTSSGNLLQFKVVPGVTGRFTVNLIQVIPLMSSSISNIFYVEEDNSGMSKNLVDNPMLFSDLSKGKIYKGKVIAVSHEGAIVSLSQGNKTQTKNYKSKKIATSNIVSVSYINNKSQNIHSTVLVSLLMDKTLIINLTSNLDEVKSFDLQLEMTLKNMYNSKIMENGDILLRTGDNMCYVYSILEGLITEKTKINDQLYQVGLKIPVRPYYNSLQWARGDHTCTSQDIDNLLGGGARYNKIVSKYEESEIAHSSLSKKGEQGRKISDGKFDLENHSYVPPVRGGAKHGYSYTQAINKAFENGVDGVETKLNDYASQAGQTISDSLEKGSKELGKSIFKSGFGL